MPDNVHYPRKAFANIGDSLLTLFVALTGESFPDVMMPAFEENRAYCIFFYVYLGINLLLILPLLTAAIFECYSEHEASASRTAFLSERFALSLAYQSLTWDKEKGVYEEIAKDEWMKCKKLFGFREISDLTMEWWFSELDTDQSGTIDEQEFYLLCETMLYEVKEKKEKEKHERSRFYNKLIEIRAILDQFPFLHIVENQKFEFFILVIVLLNTIALMLLMTEDSSRRRTARAMTPRPSRSGERCRGPTSAPTSSDAFSRCSSGSMRSVSPSSSWRRSRRSLCSARCTGRTAGACSTSCSS